MTHRIPSFLGAGLAALLATGMASFSWAHDARPHAPSHPAIPGVERPIDTVAEVQALRAHRLERMRATLGSGELSPRKAEGIQRRIDRLASKPLPTQEQIDWAIEQRLARRNEAADRGERRKSMPQRPHHRNHERRSPRDHKHVPFGRRSQREHG